MPVFRASRLLRTALDEGDDVARISVICDHDATQLSKNLNVGNSSSLNPE
jgi:hypothetical protein